MLLQGNRRAGRAGRERVITGVMLQSELDTPRIRLLHGCFYLLLTPVVLFTLLPVIWVILSSLEPANDFNSLHPPLIPRVLLWGKLVEVWQLLNFGQLYLNTLIVVAGALFCSILLNALLAYVLSQLKPRGSGLVLQIILWTLMMSSTTAIVPLYQNIVNFPLLGNLNNSYLPLWLMAGANAFNVIIFKSFFDRIPRELMEAARMDGAGNLVIFRRVIVPMSLPVISTISIFTLMTTWSDFFWPYLILTNPQIQTVMVGIFTPAFLPEDLRLVAVVLALLPPMILFIFLQRYIIKGLAFTGTGVKG